MLRVTLSVLALALCACAPHPGSAVYSDQAKTAVEEIHQTLNRAQALHEAGAVYKARDTWTVAKNTYNNKLKDGVAFHCSEHLISWEFSFDRSWKNSSC